MRAVANGSSDRTDRVDVHAGRDDDGHEVERGELAGNKKVDPGVDTRPLEVPLNANRCTCREDTRNLRTALPSGPTNDLLGVAWVRILHP